MGKKFTTLISTLALAASSLATVISPPPAFATGESEISLDDYWSFSEILELKTELETAARENCGEDYECRVEYRRQEIRSRYQEDLRYLLVGQIIDANFLVTGINPTTETVTIYYNDENMEDWEFTREESRSHLKELYLAWAEAGYPDMRNSRVSFNDGSGRSGPIYAANANNGTTTDKVHLVFAHKISDGNPADTWFEYGKENTLNVAGSNLINDTKRMLHFSVYAYEGFSAVGAVPYDEFAANYQPGMEYKLMYDKNNLFEHLVPQYAKGEEPSTPEEPSILEEPSTPEEPTEPTEEPITPEKPAEPTGESISSKESEKTAFTIRVDKISTSDLGVLITSDTNTKSTPIEKTTSTEEKGQNDNITELPLSGGIGSQNYNEEEHAFPWWIIVFIFSGIVLTLWWFIPIKKYKKTIDK